MSHMLVQREPHSSQAQFRGLSIHCLRIIVLRSYSLHLQCEDGPASTAQFNDRGPNKKSNNERTRLKYAEIQEPSDLACKLQLQ